MTSTPNSPLFKFPSSRKSGGSPPDVGKQADLPPVSGTEAHDEHVDVDEAGHHKRHSLRHRVSSFKKSIMRKARKSDSHTNGVVGGLALAFANQAQGVVFARSVSDNSHLSPEFGHDADEHAETHSEDRPKKEEPSPADNHIERSSSDTRSGDLPHTPEIANATILSHDLIEGGLTAQPHFHLSPLSLEDPDFDENDIDHAHTGVPMESIESVFDSFVATHSPPKSSVIMSESHINNIADVERPAVNRVNYSEEESRSPSPSISLESFATRVSGELHVKQDHPVIPDDTDSKLTINTLGICNLSDPPKPGIIDSGISIPADSIELVCSSSTEDQVVRDLDKRTSSLSLYDIYVEQQKSSSDLQGRIQESMVGASNSKAGSSATLLDVPLRKEDEGKLNNLPSYKISTASPSECRPRTVKPSMVPEEFDNVKDEFQFGIPYYLPTLITIAIVVIVPHINRWLH